MERLDRKIRIYHIDEIKLGNVLKRVKHYYNATDDVEDMFKASFRELSANEVVRNKEANIEAIKLRKMQQRLEYCRHTSYDIWFLADQHVRIGSGIKSRHQNAADAVYHDGMDVYPQAETVEYGHAPQTAQSHSEFLIDGFPGLKRTGIEIHVCKLNTLRMT